MARTLQASSRLRQRLSALEEVGVAQAARTWRARTFRPLAAVLGLLQREAAAFAEQAVEEMLAEQELEPEVSGLVVPEAFSGHTAAGSDDVQAFLEAAASLEQLEMAMITEVMDAARTAEEVALAARPEITGYIRAVNEATVCGRCAVLAGRFYRWSDGFLRHPQCRCHMIPVIKGQEMDLIQDPDELFKAGRIHDLTVAETEALKLGADISQVINIRRKAAGLKEAGRVLERGNRLTPEGIFQIASDRDEAIALFKRFGYLSG